MGSGFTRGGGGEGGRGEGGRGEGGGGRGGGGLQLCTSTDHQECSATALHNNKLLTI